MDWKPDSVAHFTPILIVQHKGQLCQYLILHLSVACNQRASICVIVAPIFFVFKWIRLVPCGAWLSVHELTIAI